MGKILDEHTVMQAAEYLANVDPILAPVIKQYGLCNIRTHQNYYQALASEIIGQQLSVKAAASIRQKFADLFGGTFPPPETVLKMPTENLRAAGLSWAKAMYIHDLAQHTIDGKAQFDHFDNLSNEDIIAKLTDIKGVGEWTAHMFLMFCMGRANVLATGDLGIRSAIKKLYSPQELPTPNKVKHIAKENRWHPYETVVCWYLWQSLDNTPT